ncbi:U32 family peptidase [Dorea acetigenes]|uniref:U32 family peptidase n=1 Tax=Dorea acetigenes TaxID=2981787 RepID=A0ABT2RJE8_9FIRM|nr:U32 family peptidase [Dorea acetigenes]MCU6685431.1 U32 family peptidase [Dorea acetigenes]SCI51922.1 Uncharacterized protease yhbU precursor [uncultured Clostridium sp.]
MEKKIEILAPAGSFETLKAAVLNGADAVYAGGNRFGARAYAVNFTEEELLEAIDYIHLHGRKIYLTVNTLVKENEFADLYSYLRPYYEQGLDAVIVQDIGVMKYVMRQFPGLAVHASTQMTVTNYIAAKHLEELGVERVVPARELSLSEIRQLAENTGLEIECFVHGALCYCYSGQCLMSSMIGGRSGNRGQCAQPCRLPYKVNHSKEAMDILSLKDLCAIELIPELIEAGVTSFKIEGRMKQPSYVAAVTGMYRKYVDLYLREGRKAYKVTEKDKQELLAAYQRRGYCEGYYKQQNGQKMISFGRPKASAGMEQDFTVGKLQKKMDGRLRISPGERIELAIACGEKACVSVKGAVAEPAKNQPLSIERIDRQMRKTGNTPFIFDKLEICMKGDVFLPMQSLNELRREAIEKLLSNILHNYKRNPVAEAVKIEDLDSDLKAEEYGFTASVENLEQMQMVLDAGWIKRIYLEDAVYYEEKYERLSNCVAEARRRGIEIYFSMARIFRKQAETLYKQSYSDLDKIFDGAQVRNLESYYFLREKGYKKPIVLDSNVYQWNKETKAFWKAYGVERAAAPVELNFQELRRLGIHSMELVVYGYLPVMVSAGCVKKNTSGCSSQKGMTWLTDRYQKKFVVKNECIYCYNVIYNADPVMLPDQKQKIEELHPCALRLAFSSEKADTVKEILRMYEDVFRRNKNVSMPEKGYTRGHFKRGVK